MPEAALSLGSNIGDKAANLQAAIDALGDDPGVEIVRQSSFYETEPWGDVEQDWFMNACVLLRSALPPHELLQLCQHIERAGGRVRHSDRPWGPRAIDIDVLFYGDVTLDDAALTLPHPRMLLRGFVMIPLAEIAPDHVFAEGTVAELAARLPSGAIRTWKSALSER